jgi:hypothetical protein
MRTTALVVAEVRHLPVVDDGCFVGIVSERDLRPMLPASSRRSTARTTSNDVFVSSPRRQARRPGRVLEGTRRVVRKVDWHQDLLHVLHALASAELRQHDLPRISETRHGEP